MVYSIRTSDTRAKTVIQTLLERYTNLHTNKEIEKSALCDLYMVDNNERYYVKDGYARKINDNDYEISVTIQEDNIMEIIDIKNQYVKLSKGSITVKGENGKTKGLVKGLTRFLDLQANKKIDYSKLLRNSGVWGNSKIDMNNCYILDSTVYLIRNMNSYKYYTEEEKEKYDTMYQNIASYGIMVIPCYFVK